MYSVCIFDLDGTLLDTLDDLTAAVNYAVTLHGYPIRSREEVRAFIGNGIKKLIERALGEGVSEETNASVLAAFKAYYAAHLADFTKPYDGVLELLERLQAKGKICLIHSNKADGLLQPLVKKFFGGKIQGAIGEKEEEGIAKKPSPDGVFALLLETGANKENAVYIGDSEVDIQTAKNARIDCVSVAWGFKDREFLLKKGATTVVGSVEDLEKLL